MRSDVICIRNRRRLAMPRRRRTVQIVTIEPYTCSVEDLTGVVFTVRSGGIGMVKVDISRDTR